MYVALSFSLPQIPQRVVDAVFLSILSRPAFVAHARPIGTVARPYSNTNRRRPPYLLDGFNCESIARLGSRVTQADALGETRRMLHAVNGDGDVRLVLRGVDETHGMASPRVMLLLATGLQLLIVCAADMAHEPHRT